MNAITIAYADPPYLGMSRYYDHPEAAVYDAQVVRQFVTRKLYASS